MLIIDEVVIFFDELELIGNVVLIVCEIIWEICNCIQFMANVGLNYLMLDCWVVTLSGGEVQWICLVSQLGSELMGVLYILDEFLVGFYFCDNCRLLETL